MHSESAFRVWTRPPESRYAGSFFAAPILTLARALFAVAAVAAAPVNIFTDTGSALISRKSSGSEGQV